MTDTMNLDEFEAQYRETMEQSINQLQTAVMLLSQISQVEAELIEVGQKLQALSLTVEAFISQQRAK